MTNRATRILPLISVPLLLAISLLFLFVGALERAPTSSRPFDIGTSTSTTEQSDDVGSLHLSHTRIEQQQQQQLWQPPPYHTLLRQRLLNSLVDAPVSPQGKIAWFCFVAVCVIAPITCCAVFCACRVHKRQEESRAQQEEQANTAISRIEANVKVFAEIEDQRRMQSIRRTMKRHLFVVREGDLMAPRSSDDEFEDTPEVPLGRATMTAACFRKELASPCSICLDPFAVGETLMHSIDVDACRHVFHEICISSWLVKQNTTVCPCCRQEFVGTVTPVTSLNSNDQFQSAFGGTGSGSSPRRANEEDEPLEGQV